MSREEECELGMSDFEFEVMDFSTEEIIPGLKERSFKIEFPYQTLGSKKVLSQNPGTPRGFFAVGNSPIDTEQAGYLAKSRLEWEGFTSYVILGVREIPSPRQGFDGFGIFEATGKIYSFQGRV